MTRRAEKVAKRPTSERKWRRKRRACDDERGAKRIADLGVQPPEKMTGGRSCNEKRPHAEEAKKGKVGQPGRGGDDVQDQKVVKGPSLRAVLKKWESGKVADEAIPPDLKVDEWPTFVAACDGGSFDRSASKRDYPLGSGPRGAWSGMTTATLALESVPDDALVETKVGKMYEAFHEAARPSLSPRVENCLYFRISSCSEDGDDVGAGDEGDEEEKMGEPEVDLNEKDEDTQPPERTDGEPLVEEAVEDDDDRKEHGDDDVDDKGDDVEVCGSSVRWAVLSLWHHRGCRRRR